MMPDGSCDMEHFSKKELPSWLDYARGAGIASTAAARAIQRKTAKWNSNFFRIKAADGHLDYHEAGGNGAAMRIAPIALANMRDFERAYIEIWRNSVVTHGHPRAIVGALAYARALHLVLNHQGLSNTEIIADLRHFASGLPVPSEHSGLREWLLSWNRGREKRFEVCFDETKQEMVEYIDFVERREQRPTREVLEHLGCFERATRGSGTATVAAALFIFLRHRGQFERAVIEAVNLLGADTDTVGLMVAGLVGAEVGYMGIPERCTTKLQDFPYFLRVAKALSKIALRKGTGPDLLPQMDDFVREGPNVLEAMRIGKISQGQRVVHPLLGLGWVHSVSSGWVKKRGGGKIILAHVVFDMGQSCWFRLYLAGART
jgi:ADP-ribosylglycohydrolase